MLYFKLGYLQPPSEPANVPALPPPAPSAGTPLSVLLETLEIDPEEFEALDIGEKGDEKAQAEGSPEISPQNPEKT